MASLPGCRQHRAQFLNQRGLFRGATQQLRILESCFAKYKQLQQQHSKGGFTSLLLTFPVQLRPTTAAEIIASLTRVKVADVHAWKQQHLPATLTSRRQLLRRLDANARSQPSLL
ncbi:MAG: hypothetical protein WD872_04520 [Pirellulaceae bacterium]